MPPTKAKGTIRGMKQRVCISGSGLASASLDFRRTLWVDPITREELQEELLKI